MPNPLTREDYRRDIVAQLGGTIVDIELENDIDVFLDIAFRKCKPRIGTTLYMTLPYSSSIDLTDKNVYNVVNVYRATPESNGSLLGAASNISDDSLLFSASSLTSYHNLLDIASVDSVAINLLHKQVVNQATGRSAEFDFDFTDGILYVESSNCDNVTIEYIPDYKSVEEISEPFWVNLITEYTLALTKIALGRARGKYRVSNLPYEMDADNLLSEGQQEKEALDNKLSEIHDINYYLD